MKQYCRYCVHLATGNGTWCSEHRKELSDSYAKHTNTCKDFSFCEIDAFGENQKPYQPRAQYRTRVNSEELVDQLDIFGKEV